MYEIKKVKINLIFLTSYIGSMALQKTYYIQSFGQNRLKKNIENQSNFGCTIETDQFAIQI